MPIEMNDTMLPACVASQVHTCLVLVQNCYQDESFEPLWTEKGHIHALQLAFLLSKSQDQGSWDGCPQDGDF